MKRDPDLAALTRSIPFAAYLGFEITHADQDAIVVEGVVAPEFCTAGNTAHGGFLMALADYTGAAGAYLALPKDAAGTTTVESKTNMIGAAPAGTRLRAVATPVHVGRRTSVWSTRIETSDGKLISLTSQTQLVL